MEAARSADVKFSAVTADIRCGEGTEVILYLEPGTILSRPFTEADTHDPETGELSELRVEGAAAWLCGVPLFPQHFEVHVSMVVVVSGALVVLAMVVGSCWWCLAVL